MNFYREADNSLGQHVIFTRVPNNSHCLTASLVNL
jgi:hypothetical protein